jgi:DNA-binding SARP family transcriptional activator/tetratricopeptide (TPR) repeat protein
MAGMRFGLLGPLLVHRGDAVVPVRPGKQRVLLAALLLRPGRIVGVDELAEAMWGPAPPQSERVTIRNYVKRLRIALGDAERARITTQPGGYLISVGDGELDVTQFEALLGAARAAAGACRWPDAAVQAARALALWRDEPLADVDSELLTARDVPRLAELRLHALETRISADLELGRHAGVIAELRHLAAAHPVRERLHALLMTALYRDGQQAGALAAYQAARNVLVAELGTEPGPELRRLQQQVLAGDPALAGSPAAAPARLTEARLTGAGAGQGSGPDRAGLAAEVRYSLPPDNPAFTGREDELSEIAALAAGAARPGAAVAILAIGGMPGVGKTALAIHAAHLLRDQFPDRQLFVDLRGHTPGQDPVAPEAALAGLLAAVGVDPRALPAGLDGRAALWRDRMAAQRALLVLDNAAGSAQVTPLLPGGANCMVLVTSRRHLADLPGAAVPVLLDVLAPEPAAQMFIRLAPRAAASPAEVAELTALAGFLPLAISLLARVLARHPSWTLADLAAETRASLLTLAAENDSVAAALDVSWRHLDPGLQDFLSRLGLHPGTTADAYAGAALAGVPLAQAVRRLDALHGEGLLTERGYRRYGMHDLVRRYAADRGAALPAAERDQAAGRLLDYYQYAAALAEARLSRQPRADRAAAVAVVPAAVPDLAGTAQAMAWVRAERGSLLACLDYAAATGQHARLVALTLAAGDLLTSEGPWSEVAGRYAAAAAAARQAGDRPGEAEALSNLGLARRMTGDHPGASRALADALDIAVAAGYRPGQAFALSETAALRYVMSDFAGAADAATGALDLFRHLGDRPGEASVLLCLGAVRVSAGDYADAVGQFTEALRIYRDLGSRPGQASALNSLGAVRRATGESEDAARDLTEALALFRDLGNLPGLASALGNLGEARREAGEIEGATAAMSQALDIFRDLGDRRGQARALSNLGVLRRDAGDYPAAALALAEALALARALDDRDAAAEILNETGTLQRDQGEAGRARDSHQQALVLARDVASPWSEACALAGLARCDLAAGDTAAATAGLRHAREILERIGAAEAARITVELEAITRSPRATKNP